MMANGATSGADAVEGQVTMESLRDLLEQTIPRDREAIRNLVSEYGPEVIDQVTVAQVFSGMRGVKVLHCDTSRVDPHLGLLVREIPIADLTERLPEELFILLCAGQLPSEGVVSSLQEDLQKRSEVPAHVWRVLGDLPRDTHPMSMLNIGLMAMQGDSTFAREYASGTLTKQDYWKATLEDALTLVGRLPALAAGIYRLRFDKGERIEARSDLDWAANFAHMLGVEDSTGEFRKLMQLYMVLHCDHEGGNVSAHTCHLVASALSDLYYSVSAGLSGLAGPLHGLANQECLRFLQSILEGLGNEPSDEALERFTWDHLRGGQVIPGYGHAVLRCADPRFIAFLDFGRRVCPEDEVFRLVDQVYRVVPGVLTAHGKAKNPYPNVDAVSGSLLHHFGVTEFSYYTVLFAVSRALGMCAQAILSRALLMSIERPKSVSTNWIRQAVEQKD